MPKEIIKDSCGGCGDGSEQIITCPFCFKENYVIINENNEILYVSGCKHFKYEVGDIIK